MCMEGYRFIPYGSSLEIPYIDMTYVRGCCVRPQLSPVLLLSRGRVLVEIAIHSQLSLSHNISSSALLYRISPHTPAHM